MKLLTFPFHTFLFCLVNISCFQVEIWFPWFLSIFQSMVNSCLYTKVVLMLRKYQAKKYWKTEESWTNGSLKKPLMSRRLRYIPQVLSQFGHGIYHLTHKTFMFIMFTEDKSTANHIIWHKNNRFLNCLYCNQKLQT